MQVRRFGVAVSAMVAATLSACSLMPDFGGGGTGTPAPASSASSLPRAQSTPDVPVGNVEVLVSQLTGAEGGTLAGIVSDTPWSEGLGGFVVRVDSDPFSTTETVTEAGQMKPGGLFPYVTSSPLTLGPGRYILRLWAAPRDLGPYARWIPADATGLRGCNIPFEVGPHKGAFVSVTNVPVWHGEDRDPICETQ